MEPIFAYMCVSKHLYIYIYHFVIQYVCVFKKEIKAPWGIFSQHFEGSIILENPLKALRDIFSFIMIGNVFAVTWSKARDLEHSVMYETVHKV